MSQNSHELWLLVFTERNLCEKVLKSVDLVGSERRNTIQRVLNEIYRRLRSLQYIVRIVCSYSEKMKQCIQPPTPVSVVSIPLRGILGAHTFDKNEQWSALNTRKKTTKAGPFSWKREYQKRFQLSQWPECGASTTIQTCTDKERNVFHDIQT